MLNNERDLVTRLLKQNIVTLCKETVSYDTQLEIDGIICISTGNESQQIVVKVHNFFQKLGNKPQHSLKSTQHEIFKQNANKHEWQDRTEEKRYPISDTNGTGFQGQDGHIQNTLINLKHEPIPSIKNDEVNFHKSHVLMNLDLKLNGFEGDAEPVKKNIEPQIPRTISSLDPDETDCIDNDSNDSLSGTDTMDYEDTRMNNEADISFNENVHMTSNVPRQSPAKLSPNKMSSSPLDAKISRKHPSPDENSMIECKLGKNCSTDEDLSKIPVRHVKDIPCKRCGVILDDGSAFEQHNTDVHSVYTCRVCFNTFTCRNNMKRHMRLHTGFRPYTCKLCSESFTRKDDIKRHLIRHSFDKPFRCNLCRKGYMDRKTVKNHIRKEHNSKIIHICQTCGEAFDNSVKFQEHKKNHPELKMFQCSLCKFTGSNLLTYNKHQLIHETKKNYRCEPCDLVFGDPIRYTTHLRKHRLDPNFISYRCCFCDMALSSYELFMRHEHTHDQSKQFTCYVCMKQFQSEATLKEHKLSHPTYNCENEAPLSSGPALPRIIDTQMVIQQPIFPTFMRALSPYDGSDQSNNDAHISTKVARKDNGQNVTDISKPVSNNSYEENAITVKIEKTEFEATENQQNDYWCAECQHGFATEEHLTEHIALAHEGNSLDNATSEMEEQDNIRLHQLATDKTHKGFTESAQNNIYEMSDNDESCDELETFSESVEKPIDSSNSIRYTPVPIFSGTKQNKRASPRIESKTEDNQSPKGSPDSPEGIYHRSSEDDSSSPPSLEMQEYSNRVIDEYYGNNRGEKNYHAKNNFTCDICFHRFPDFESFDQHSSMIHRKFVCHFCGKGFTSRPNRDRHVRYHTGEKPFKCDVCQQCFVRGDDLRYHRTSKHPDIKPYTCNICGMSFPWAKDLERHAKTHGIS